MKNKKVKLTERVFNEVVKNLNKKNSHLTNIILLIDVKKIIIQMLKRKKKTTNKIS